MRPLLPFQVTAEPAEMAEQRRSLFSRRDSAWETAPAGDVFWLDAGVLERFRP